MLEFSAETYVDIAQQLGMIIGALKGQGTATHDFNKAFNTILGDAESLGLVVTRDQVARMIVEQVSADRTKAHLTDGVLHIQDQAIDPNRLLYHMETVITVLKSELRSIKFRAIPKEKARYCDPKWLTDGVLFDKYPDTVDEFQRAGRCFAFGENTACIFHLMRVTEFYLNKVADSLGVPFNPLGWDHIGKHLTKEMEKKYHDKTAAWKSSEPFYASVLTDIQAISKGHRNSALHDIERKYEERDASYMLTVIEQFSTHVAEKL
jgi:hypothetical protein